MSTLFTDFLSSSSYHDLDWPTMAASSKSSSSSSKSSFMASKVCLLAAVGASAVLGADAFAFSKVGTPYLLISVARGFEMGLPRLQIMARKASPGRWGKPLSERDGDSGSLCCIPVILTHGRVAGCNYRPPARAPCQRCGQRALPGFRSAPTCLVMPSYRYVFITLAMPAPYESRRAPRAANPWYGHFPGHCEAFADPSVCRTRHNQDAQDGPCQRL